MSAKTSMSTLAALGMAAMLAACGHSPGERALSGGAIGAGAGAGLAAITGGAVGTGAIVGGAAGAATGAITADDD